MTQNELIRLYRRFLDLRNQSLSMVMQRGIEKVGVYLAEPHARRSLGQESFSCLGKTYPYFIHSYNATWRNERAVEVPLMLDFLTEQAGKRILELGNVSYYYHGVPKHDVIDKYEKTPGVMNLDFITYAPSRPYEAFLSVSTFEHIGWDETPKQPAKIVAAFQRIPQLIQDTSKVFITCPLGYNTALDELLKTNSLKFERLSYLIRINKENRWIECGAHEALTTVYGSRYPGANAIFVGRGFKGM